MLVVLLDGLWAGIKANVTTYEDNVGADLYVAQPGTRNFFGAISRIPSSSVETVAADPDVKWAVAVRGFFSIVELHNRKVPSFVIGFTPGQRGGPWELRQGRAPLRDNEVTIGRVMAKRHNLNVGDRIEIMGHPSQFGTALGLKSSASSLGQFLGPLVGGSMLAWRASSPYALPHLCFWCSEGSWPGAPRNLTPTDGTPTDKSSTAIISRYQVSSDRRRRRSVQPASTVRVRRCLAGVDRSALRVPTHCLFARFPRATR